MFLSLVMGQGGRGGGGFLKGVQLLLEFKPGGRFFDLVVVFCHF